jgi:hypothetical protein
MLSEQDFKDWIEERNAVLRSKDLAALRQHMEKYGTTLDTSDEVLEVAMHKARTACLGLTEDERRESREWLTARNFSHFGDTP